MLDPIRLRAVRAVGLDVDGTIAGADHAISPRTITAIRRLVALGLPVFLLTGRARANVLELARAAGIHNPVASNNGSVLFDPVGDRDLDVRPMTHEDARAVFALADELGLEYTWWTTDDIFVDRDGECRALLHDLNEKDVRVDDPARLPEGITKVMLHGSAADLDRVSRTVTARFPTASRSMGEFFEFMAPGADKWTALSSLLEWAEVDPATCLGMGDGGNDVPWLSRIGTPIAMGNARREVLDVAHGVTGHHDAHGAAEVLEALADALSRTEVTR